MKEIKTHSTTLFSSLKKTANKWIKLSNQLRQQCIEYLLELLHNNKNSIDWEDLELPEYVSVAYDGGNHPEYASNVFSTVYGIKVDKNIIYLKIEDCDNYDISNVSVSELYDICEFLNQYKQSIC